VDSSGYVHIVYSAYRNSAHGINYTTNKSGIWAETPNVIQSVFASYLDLELYGDKPYVMYNHRYYSPPFTEIDQEMYNLNLVYQEGANWKVTTLNSKAAYGYLSLGIDANGYLHVSYRNTSGHLTYGTNKDGSWGFKALDSVNYDYHNALAVDSGGHVHIAYRLTGLKYLTW
jgi:hypothetical protein